jgi:excisionase family DNA binding protein
LRCVEQWIGGTMLYQKTTELVSNGVIGRRLLNVKEAAQYLGLEVDTVYRKSRLREVPCVKVGRALRFDMRALERYIEQHTIETID